MLFESYFCVLEADAKTIYEQRADAKYIHIQTPSQDISLRICSVSMFVNVRLTVKCATMSNHVGNALQNHWYSKILSLIFIIVANRLTGKPCPSRYNTTKNKNVIAVNYCTISYFSIQ